MKLYVFRSETDPDLFGHTDDQTGGKLAEEQPWFAPWTLVGSYEQLDAVAERDVRTHGYSLRRASEEAEPDGEPQ